MCTCCAAVLPPRWRELEAEPGSAARQHTSAVAGNGSNGAEEGEAPLGSQQPTGSSADGEAGAGVEPAAAQGGAYADDAPAGDSGSDGEGAVGDPSAASLLFYGVRGQQMREGDAPSYFNPVEVRRQALLPLDRAGGKPRVADVRSGRVHCAALHGAPHIWACAAAAHISCCLQASTIVELVSGLLGSGAGVRPDDIGVMATYRKQVGHYCWFESEPTNSCC